MLRKGESRRKNKLKNKRKLKIRRNTQILIKTNFRKKVCLKFSQINLKNGFKQQENIKNFKKYLN